MQTMYPKKRAEKLFLQQVGQEVVIYDELTHKAFCLNAVATAIWQSCDGTRSTEQLAEAATLALDLPVIEDAVLFSLRSFTRDGLLEAGIEAVLPVGLTRRAMIAKLGIRAAILLPVVAAIATPRKAHAYNGCANCPSS